MGFRFWRRVRIAPGVTLNLSKSGGSLSLGPRGAKFTVGPHGRRSTVGLPGTGLFYTATDHHGTRGRQNSAGARHSVPAIAPEDRLSLGFFRRLITPDNEEALVDGCRELALGDENSAFRHLANATHLADGAYLAGFLALKKERLDDAERWLNQALDKQAELGRYFAKYGISAVTSLAITDEICAHVSADHHGILLGLVEVYQHQANWKQAMECLKTLRRIAPDDVVVKLSLAELMLEATPDNKAACKKVIELTRGIENETPIHAALMLYKAKALRTLGLYTAAVDTLTAALRRKKDRSDELLRAIRYERALIYTALGRKARARSEFEKIYALAPDYEDVAARLGL